MKCGSVFFFFGNSVILLKFLCPKKLREDVRAAGRKRVHKEGNKVPCVFSFMDRYNKFS